MCTLVAVRAAGSGVVTISRPRAAAEHEAGPRRSAPRSWVLQVVLRPYEGQ